MFLAISVTRTESSWIYYYSMSKIDFYI